MSIKLIVTSTTKTRDSLAELIPNSSVVRSDQDLQNMIESAKQPHNNHVWVSTKQWVMNGFALSEDVQILTVENLTDVKDIGFTKQEKVQLAFRVRCKETNAALPHHSKYTGI